MKIFFRFVHSSTREQTIYEKRNLYIALCTLYYTYKIMMWLPSGAV